MMRLRIACISELGWVRLLLRRTVKVYGDSNTFAPRHDETFEQRCTIIISTMILITTAMKFKVNFIDRLS